MKSKVSAVPVALQGECYEYSVSATDMFFMRFIRVGIKGGRSGVE
jgi:hypothetical protein